MSETPTRSVRITVGVDMAVIDQIRESSYDRIEDSGLVASEVVDRFVRRVDHGYVSLVGELRFDAPRARPERVAICLTPETSKLLLACCRQLNLSKARVVRVALADAAA